ncbi:MAG: hypothetical protein AB1782_16905 [Cyanobacteriota bacterium]
MYKKKLYKHKKLKGWGLVESLILICIVGLIALVIINGMTTTALVMTETGNKERIEEIANSYLNEVYEKSKDKTFYNNIDEGEFPPVPLVSKYTDSGKYTVLVETTQESENSKKITITFSNPGSTSRTEPIMIFSTIVKDPEEY